MGDFDVEIGSIRSTVSWMESNAIETATKLQETLSKLNSYAVASDWSEVPSCIAFGASYNSAIAAYKSVADDLLADAKKMSAALSKIADDYETADAGARARFDAAIARFVDAGYMTQTPADQTYKEHRGDLHSDHPEQAPAQDSDTGHGGSSQPSTPAPTTTGSGHVRME